MSMKMKLYQAIAREADRRRAGAIANRNDIVNDADKCIGALNDLLPSGSGIDSGTVIDTEKSGADRVVLDVDFHHMSSSGYYDGWTSHSVIVTPSLAHEFELRVTGRDHNEIKDYLYEVYSDALAEDVELTADGYELAKVER